MQFLPQFPGIYYEFGHVFVSWILTLKWRMVHEDVIEFLADLDNKDEGIPKPYRITIEGLSKILKKLLYDT